MTMDIKYFMNRVKEEERRKKEREKERKREQLSESVSGAGFPISFPFFFSLTKDVFTKSKHRLGKEY